MLQGVDPHEYVKEQAKYSKEKPRLKLSELEEAYLKHCAVTNKPKTMELKREAFRNLREFLNDSYVDKLVPEQIEDWMSKQDASKTTIDKKLRAINAMFNWGIAREIIDSTPFKNSAVRQYSVPDSNPEDYFTLEEVEFILQTLKKEDKVFWRLVYLALETGGRLTELLSLTAKDIELDNSRVFFKGESAKNLERRHVPIRSNAVEKISSWNLKNTESLFSWKLANSVSRRFRNFLIRHDLRTRNNADRSFHTLCHTYASHLLMEGINIFVVSRWLGHSSVLVTEKHYGHVIPDRVEVLLPRDTN